METWTEKNTLREVVLHLPDAVYERLIEAAVAVHKPLEQWIADVLMAVPWVAVHTAVSHDVLAATLDALGFERLAPEKARRLSTLLQSRKERPLSDDETAELQTLMIEANALECASLQRLAAVLWR